MKPSHLSELLEASARALRAWPANDPNRRVLEDVLSQLVEALGRAKDAARGWRERYRDLARAVRLPSELDLLRLDDEMSWTTRLPGGALHE